MHPGERADERNLLLTECREYNIHQNSKGMINVRAELAIPSPDWLAFTCRSFRDEVAERPLGFLGWAATSSWDLLNLARATKSFRALLMSRQSVRFWREARLQVEDLPDLPSYLSEPAYANLLFFPHCHVSFFT